MLPSYKIGTKKKSTVRLIGTVDFLHLFVAYYDTWHKDNLAFAISVGRAETMPVIRFPFNRPFDLFRRS